MPPVDKQKHNNVPAAKQRDKASPQKAATSTTRSKKATTTAKKNRHNGDSDNDLEEESSVVHEKKKLRAGDDEEEEEDEDDNPVPRSSSSTSSTERKSSPIIVGAPPSSFRRSTGTSSTSSRLDHSSSRSPSPSHLIRLDHLSIGSPAAPRPPSSSSSSLSSTRRRSTSAAPSLAAKSLSFDDATAALMRSLEEKEEQREQAHQQRMQQIAAQQQQRDEEHKRSMEELNEMKASLKRHANKPVEADASDQHVPKKAAVTKDYAKKGKYGSELKNDGVPLTPAQERENLKLKDTLHDRAKEEWDRDGSERPKWNYAQFSSKHRWDSQENQDALKAVMGVLRSAKGEWDDEAIVHQLYTIHRGQHYSYKRAIKDDTKIQDELERLEKKWKDEKEEAKDGIFPKEQERVRLENEAKAKKQKLARHSTDKTRKVKRRTKTLDDKRKNGGTLRGKLVDAAQYAKVKQALVHCNMSSDESDNENPPRRDSAAAAAVSESKNDLVAPVAAAAATAPTKKKAIHGFRTKTLAWRSEECNAIMAELDKDYWIHLQKTNQSAFEMRRERLASNLICNRPVPSAKHKLPDWVMGNGYAAGDKIRAE